MSLCLRNAYRVWPHLTTSMLMPPHHLGCHSSPLNLPHPILCSLPNVTETWSHGRQILSLLHLLKLLFCPSKRWGPHHAREAQHPSAPGSCHSTHRHLVLLSHATLSPWSHLPGFQWLTSFPDVTCSWDPLFRITLPCAHSSLPFPALLLSRHQPHWIFSKLTRYFTDYLTSPLKQKLLGARGLWLTLSLLCVHAQDRAWPTEEVRIFSEWSMAEESQQWGTGTQGQRPGQWPYAHWGLGSESVRIEDFSGVECTGFGNKVRATGGGCKPELQLMTFMHMEKARGMRGVGEGGGMVDRKSSIFVN